MIDKVMVSIKTTGLLKSQLLVQIETGQHYLDLKANFILPKLLDSVMLKQHCLIKLEGKIKLLLKGRNQDHFRLEVTKNEVI